MPQQATEGDGYAVSSLEDLGEGYGFRKVRRGLGVTAFGINAIVLPPGYSTGEHYHDEQEETYFVHAGEVEFHFGDGSTHVLKAGGLARVDPQTHRGMGKGGYVGRDGQAVGEVHHGDPPGGRPPGTA
jgi:quercetin dioxygenase-like cupin family protein